ncbi:hypothetical protein [Methylocystis echinoides]|uniref:Uncharacterized protein n=1 Tax=Methylocystis echinoides TaxID=29468 RepID=A0A9W6LRF7_9HYPH|nr:hypothetical protein [Methylocystis echinoides]GLI92361.1 hypothetical protein LMG27198_13530 [Methylocystis echinoides]
MTELPESLRVRPNIPWRDQTLAQLRQERDYWAEKLESGGAALEFMRECERWIRRREKEAQQ